MPCEPPPKRSKTHCVRALEPRADLARSHHSIDRIRRNTSTPDAASIRTRTSSPTTHSHRHFECRKRKQTRHQSPPNPIPDWFILSHPICRGRSGRAGGLPATALTVHGGRKGWCVSERSNPGRSQQVKPNIRSPAYSPTRRYRHHRRHAISLARQNNRCGPWRRSGNC